MTVVDGTNQSPSRVQRQVFVAHSSTDVGAARALCQLLQEHGLTGWMAPDNIRGSRPWPEQILGAIERSSLVVVLVSTASNASEHVTREVTHAVATACALLPIRLEDVKPAGALAYMLNLAQWIDAFPDGVPEHRDALLARVDDALSGDVPQPPRDDHVRLGDGPGPRPAALPAAVNEFVGRETGTAELLALLARPGVRLVTLVGPGGVGKTRLALEVGRKIAGERKHQVGFVELAAITDPDHVLPAVARALDVAVSPTAPLVETMAQAIGDQPVLVILDNCEQVLDMAPELGDLLAAAPNLQVLATSRSPLRLAAEKVFTVQPLPAGESGSAGAQLFIARADAVRPGLAWSTENLEAAATIAGAVDGLPLAIELAAGRSNVLSPVALAARLAQHRDLLTEGTRDLPKRQRSLRTTIAWSYDLLEDTDRRVFEAISVFAGGFRLDGATAVLQLDDVALLESLGGLVDASLLQRRDDDDGEPRFSLLPTVREYAATRLTASSAGTAVRNRHLAWVSALTLEASAQLSSEQAVPFRPEDELGNIRAACDYARQSGREADAAQIVTDLRFFWDRAGHAREGLQLAQALTNAAGIEEGIRGRLFLTVAHLLQFVGDNAAAILAGQQGMRLAQAAGDLATQAHLLGILAISSLFLGDEAAAEDYLRQGRGMQDASGDEQDMAGSMAQYGLLALYRRDYEEARATLTPVLAHERGRGLDESSTPLNLAWAYIGLRDLANASEMIRLALEYDLAASSAEGVAYNLVASAAIAVDVNMNDTAARLATAGTLLLDSVEAKFQPYEQRILDRTLATCRDRLSPEEFNRTEAKARAMTLDESVALANTILQHAAGHTNVSHR